MEDVQKMPRRVLLEVCIASVDDVLAAEAGGADRIELNSALSLGGLTPSAGLFAEVRRATRLPVVAMVRPRPGGFCYSPTDFDVMCRDTNAFLDAGAEGLAFGILTESGEIDVDRCGRLRERCGDRVAVFHRAFDVTPDPFAALETLVALGFRRVMTSGQEETAYNGAELIAELICRAAGRIEILPAGGINRFNVTDVIVRTGCGQVHASLRMGYRDASVAARPGITFGSSIRLPEDRVDRTDVQAVAGIAAILKGPLMGNKT
jgi:copper homeostasis protein